MQPNKWELLKKLKEQEKDAIKGKDTRKTHSGSIAGSLNPLAMQPNNSRKENKEEKKKQEPITCGKCGKQGHFSGVCINPPMSK